VSRCCNLSSLIFFHFHQSRFTTPIHKASSTDWLAWFAWKSRKSTVHGIDTLFLNISLAFLGELRLVCTGPSVVPGGDLIMDCMGMAVGGCFDFQAQAFGMTLEPTGRAGDVRLDGWAR
jgi:hypothetical protein